MYKLQQFTATALAFALIFGGCANEQTLSANKTTQAIQRATWATAMLQQARHVVEPWNSLPIDFDEDQLYAHLADVYGSCAHAERLSEPEVEPAVWHVSIDANCEDHSNACTGNLQIQTDPIADENTPPWLHIHHVELQCYGTDVNQGSFRLRKQGDAAQETKPNEDHNTPTHVDVADLAFLHNDETTLAAENFEARFSLYPQTVYANDNTPLNSAIANGEATFDDADASRAWAVNIEDLALYQSNATPRGGTLRLRTLDDNTYDLRTEWLPKTEFSTQVTVHSGKEQWIGCIDHDKDHPACNN